MMRVFWVTCAVLSLSIFNSIVRGDVKPAAIFADGMIVQRDAPIVVWGTCDKDESVKVSCGDFNVSQDKSGGAWRVSLPAHPAGAMPDITIAGKNTITIKNILAGDVWLCSGQSNMEWVLAKAKDAEKEIAAANYPQIREFHVRGAIPHEPQTEFAGNWMECNPENAPKMSAVAYFFARNLQKELNVPIGLVNASAGWTPAEAWMSRQALSADPFKKDILDVWDGWDKQYPIAKKAYDERLAAWKKSSEEAKAKGAETGPEPKAPSDPNFIHRAAGFYNGCIAPLAPLKLKGVIWYQGETNIERGAQYRKLFPALIQDWRRTFNDESLPFLWVQLAAVGAVSTDPAADSPWAETRESQSMTLAIPHTAMAVTIDIGDKEVHPPNKQDVGKRLALGALATVYGKSVEYQGPTYKSMKVEGDAIRIEFDHADGLKTSDPAIKGFAIAGEDHKFVWADATIQGTSVIVKSEKVTKPVAVRYAWSDYPVVSVFSGIDLPAVPFRTDDWPMMTEGKVAMFYDQIGMDPVTMVPK